MEGESKEAASGNQIGPLVMMLDKPALALVLKHLSRGELERLTKVCDQTFKSKIPSESDRVTAGRRFPSSDIHGEANHLKEALVAGHRCRRH